VRTHPIRSMAVAAALVIAALATTSTVTPAGAQTPTGLAPSAAVGFNGALVSGQAWGAQASLAGSSLPAVNQGKVAWQTLQCIPVSGKTVTNQGALSTVDAPTPGVSTSVLSGGAVVDAGTPTVNVTSADAVERSTVASVSLLNGMIQATALDSHAHTTLDATGLNHHSTVDDGFYPGGNDGSTGATFASLSIAGTSVSLPVPANTTIALPGGIGSVTLNEQVLGGATTSVTGAQVPSQVTVRAIHVRLTNLGGYAGDIEVATAFTTVRNSPASLRGYAFTASLAIPSPLVVGRQNINYLPCVGTNDLDVPQSTPSVSIPGVLTSGTGTSTVHGARLTSPANSISTAQVQTVDVGTFLHADAITIQARTRGTTLTTPQVSSDEPVATFVNLVINGTPITAPLPNQTISVPGVGTVTLNRQLCTSDDPNNPHACTGSHYDEMIATAIVIRITVPSNPLGLPTGAEIRIAEAETAVQS